MILNEPSAFNSPQIISCPACKLSFNPACYPGWNAAAIKAGDFVICPGCCELMTFTGQGLEARAADLKDLMKLTKEQHRALDAAIAMAKQRRLAPGALGLDALPLKPEPPKETL